MSIVFIIGIIVFGLLLVLVEIFFLPGTTISGLLGIGSIIGGIVLSYVHLGTEMGNTILLCSMAIGLIFIMLAYRKLKSGDISLNEDMSQSRVPSPAFHKVTRNIGNHDDHTVDKLYAVKVGDKGIALGDIKPTGKAIINNLTYIVKSAEGFIPDNASIEVVAIRQNSVDVRLI